MRLHHLAVVVSDLGRSEAFYAGVLGLPVVSRHEGRAVWLDLEGVILMLELGRAPSVPLTGRQRHPEQDQAMPERLQAANGWHCVALSIPRGDRNGWRTRLEQSGVPIVKESQYSLYVRDPDGALVALSHHPQAA